MDSLTLADGVDQSLITAGLQRLQDSRDGLYQCLGRRRDALFELVDALLAAEAVPSLPHLSLVPAHRRGWGSVYAALAAALRGFREEVFGCLGRRRDALFELVDGLLAAESMPSLPHLSLLPVHRRGWGSVYAALAVGEVDAERLATVLAAQALRVAHPVFAVDASTWARCDAECSPGRGFYYSPTRHSAGQPIVAGWCPARISGWPLPPRSAS